MSGDVWCQRCMVIVNDGRCPRCGFDYNVSTLTPQDRQVMAEVLRGLAPRKRGREK